METTQALVKNAIDGIHQFVVENYKASARILRGNIALGSKNQGPKFAVTKTCKPFNSQSQLWRQNIFLTSESVDEILCCDHSNETSSAVLLQGTIFLSKLCKMKLEIFLEF